jgi:tRNA nucleotidyltransferase (CCA-adding enzyme)
MVNLFDPFDGLKTWKKDFKTPLDPDITYSDDPLRMMRAIVFNQLNFEIEESSLQSITKMQTELIFQSAFVDELNKILSTDKPSIGFFTTKTGS